MSYFELEVITHYEMSSSTSRSLSGRYADKAEALSAAIDYGNELAGPVMEGYRRPTVAVVFDEVLGATVKVGSGDTDSMYHVIYSLESGRRVERPADTGRGYVVCKV